jgi:hypothetical protein
MYRAQLSPEQKVTRMMAAKDILKNIESYSTLRISVNGRPKKRLSLLAAYGTKSRCAFLII